MQVHWNHVSVFIASLCGAVACDPGPGQGTDPAARPLAAPEVAGTWAHVLIRGRHHWNPRPGESRHRLELWAVFVAHEGISASVAARQLGVVADGDELGKGQCHRSAGGAVPQALDPDLDSEEASVELLDAGALYFRLPGQAHLVRPSVYPDVLPHVSGLEYRKVLPDPPDGVSTRQISVLGLGGREVSTFELLHQTGPREFRIRVVGGGTPGDGPLTVSAEAPLRVRWDPAQPQFQVRIRIAAGDPGARASGALVCRPRAAGGMTLPARWLRSLVRGRAGVEGTLEVRIEQRVETRVPGAERATLVLSQSDEVSISLQP